LGHVFEEANDATARADGRVLDARAVFDDGFRSLLDQPIAKIRNDTGVASELFRHADLDQVAGNTRDDGVVVPLGFRLMQLNRHGPSRILPLVIKLLGAGLCSQVKLLAVLAHELLDRAARVEAKIAVALGPTRVPRDIGYAFQRVLLAGLELIGQ